MKPAPTGTLSAEAQAKLNGFRAQIDGIDAQLIALLKQRIGIVSEVGKLKHKDGNLQCFIRSGREADMLRDVYAAFDGSAFHPLAACAIWRMIIAASTQHEAPMEIISLPELKTAAKLYFGDFKPFIECSSPQDYLHQLAAHPKALLILPHWQAQPDFWREIFAHAPQTLKVFAAIPFAGKAPEAFVAANLTPERSRDDISLFLDTQTGHIEQHDGYHRQVPIASGSDISHKQWLGTYARPIGGKS